MKFTWTWSRIRSRARQIWSGYVAVTHSRQTQPRMSRSPNYPTDNNLDVFEGYSFNVRHSIVIVEEEDVSGKEKPEGVEQDGEFDPEKVLESNDLTEKTILITEALQSPTLTRRLPELPPTPTKRRLGPVTQCYSTCNSRYPNPCTSIATHTPNRCSCERCGRSFRTPPPLCPTPVLPTQAALPTGKCRTSPSEEGSCSGFRARPPSR